MQEEKGLLQALEDYAAGDTYPFHMPGHKRVPVFSDDPYAIDITEIDGFDDLHHPQGLLAQVQRKAAELYGANKTHLLVGGSTAGILTALGVLGVLGKTAGRRKVLVARNAHRSVFHGLYLNRLTPVYVYPGSRKDLLAGAINPEDVAAAIKAHPDLCGVIITSPTYDGIISDVAEIARIAHHNQLPLVVDEAHGAHFGMHPDLPVSSVSCGADLVIHSLHKTLPALTQTALLHLQGDLVQEALVARFARIYQTSSPSYVLMASADACLSLLAREREERFCNFLQRMQSFRSALGDLQMLRLLHVDDPGKILVDGAGRLSGVEICAMLRSRFHLEPEMAAGRYALCIATIADTREGLDRLADALRSIDGQLLCSCKDERKAKEIGFSAPGGAFKEMLPPDASRARAAISIWEAWDAPAMAVPLEESAGRICGEFAYLYPPGIPLLVPGEVILPEVLEQLALARAAGCALQGLEDLTGKTVRVLPMTDCKRMKEMPLR